MTIREIVRKWLEENGFDGLCGEECGCAIDDFAPCVNWDCVGILDCKPAYRIKCKGLACENKCDGYDEEGNNDCFTTKKPEARP